MLCSRHNSHCPEPYIIGLWSLRHKQFLIGDILIQRFRRIQCSCTAQWKYRLIAHLCNILLPLLVWQELSIIYLRRVCQSTKNLSRRSQMSLIQALQKATFVHQVIINCHQNIVWAQFQCWNKLLVRTYIVTKADLNSILLAEFCELNRQIL